MDWWVTTGDRKPIGPVSTELLLQGIGAGKVPNDALVCEVGGTRWTSIGAVAVFAAALEERKRAGRFDPDSKGGALGKFDDSAEHTIAEFSQDFLSEPSLHDAPPTLDDNEEKTIVDLVPLRPSEPPK